MLEEDVLRVVQEACFDLDNGIVDTSLLSDQDFREAVRYFLGDDDREVAPFKRFMNSQVRLFDSVREFLVTAMLDVSRVQATFSRSGLTRTTFARFQLSNREHEISMQRRCSTATLPIVILSQCSIL